MFALLYTVCAAVFLRIASYILPSCITEAYACLGCMILSLIVIYTCYPLVKRRYYNGRVPTHNKAILITGCDTGFGNQLARRLDSAGFHVFASCLFPEGEGAKSLAKTCSSRLKVLKLDVKKDESIAEAVTFVKENMSACELWAVVNNAGIHQGCSVEMTTVEQFKNVLDVNSLGPVRVTKAFIPLLRTSKGRVVTVVSVAGRIAFPYLTAYVMSKYAAAAFNDCLRMELDTWGVKVISVEPEAYQTNITDYDSVKLGLKENFLSLDTDTKEDYGENYFENFDTVTKSVLSWASEKTYQVVDCLEDAVSLKYPEMVYRPSRNCVLKTIAKLYEVLPFAVQHTIAMFVQCVLRVPVPREAESKY